MNAEYGNIIQIFLKNQVEKIENNQVVSKIGETPVTVHAQDFDINASVNDSPESLLTTIPLSLYVDKLKADDARTFRIKRSVILQICKSDGENKIIGSLQYPAQLIFTESLNRDILKIEHKQPSYLDN